LINPIKLGDQTHVLYLLVTPHHGNLGALAWVQCFGQGLDQIHIEQGALCIKHHSFDPHVVSLVNQSTVLASCPNKIALAFSSTVGAVLTDLAIS
jgi:hypothetical protein